MKRVMVRYRVKPDRVEENEQYIRAVFAELEKSAPDGVRYASFKQDDGASFVHIASIEAEANPLQDLSAFKAFTADIRERCDEPPVAVELSEIGSYRLLGG